MKSGIIVLFVLCVFAVASPATIPEKYQTIVDRNSFGLNPVAAIEATPAPVIPPSDIKLTGFAQTVGQSKAFFVIQSKDPKEPARYVSLAQGEKEGILELLSISDSQDEVKIRNTGVEMVLSLKNNGFKQEQSGPNMTPPQQPQPVAVYPGQNSQPSPSPIYNSGAAPVVAAYNSEAVAGIKPASPTLAGGMTMARNSAATIGSISGPSQNPSSVIYNSGSYASAPSPASQPVSNVSVPVSSGQSPQIALGGNSAVFSPPRSRNSATSEIPEEIVSPEVQRILWEAKVIEEKRLGRVTPPLPPFPGQTQ